MAATTSTPRSGHTATYRPVPLRRITADDGVHSVGPQETGMFATTATQPPVYQDDCTTVCGARFVVNHFDPAVTLVQLAGCTPLVYSEDVSLQWLCPTQTGAMAAMTDEVAHHADLMLRTWMDFRKSHSILYSPARGPHPLAITEFILTCENLPESGWKLWTSYFLPVENIKASELLRAIEQAGRTTPALTDGCVYDVGDFVSTVALPRRTRFRAPAVSSSSFPPKWNRLRPERMTCFIMDVRVSLQFTVYHRDLPAPISFDVIQAEECDFLGQCVAFFRYMCSSATLAEGDVRWHTGELLDTTISSKEPVGFVVQHQQIHHQFYVPGAPGQFALEMLLALMFHTRSRYVSQQQQQQQKQQQQEAEARLVSLTRIDRNHTPFQAIGYLPALPPLQGSMWTNVLAATNQNKNRQRKATVQANPASADASGSASSSSASGFIRQMRTLEAHCVGSPYQPIVYRQGPLTDIFLPMSLMSTPGGGGTNHSQLVPVHSLPLFPSKGRGATHQQQQLSILQWHHKQHTVQTTVHSLAAATPPSTFRYIRLLSTNRLYKIATLIPGVGSAVVAASPVSTSAARSAAASSASAVSKGHSTADADMDAMMEMDEDQLDEFILANHA